MKKTLKIGLGIVISIIVVIVIAYLLFFGNCRYIFPVEIGKIELNYEVQPHVCTNGFPVDVLELLDQIEQEQSCVDIEELEQLRKKIEGIDGGYIIYAYRRPLQYIEYYEGEPILGDLSDGCGPYAIRGEDNGNMLYLYHVRQKIDLDHDGFFIPLH